jgi:hypothetical protein
MYLAIDFWYWILIIWVASYVLFHLYGYYARGIIRAVLNVCAFIGVIVHEFSHLIVTVLCGLPVEQLEIRWRHPQVNVIAPHGSVRQGDFPRRTFMKGFMICFAPLLVSTFLIFACIDILTLIETAWYINIGTLFFIGSVVLGAAPSKADLSNIGLAIANDPILGLSQATCYGISVFIGIQFINLSKLVLPFEFMYYALYFFASIMIYFIIFYSLKWTGMGIRAIYRKVARRDNELSNRSLKRRRIKSKKPPKEKEGEWW